MLPKSQTKYNIFKHSPKFYSFRDRFNCSIGVMKVASRPIELLLHYTPTPYQIFAESRQFFEMSTLECLQRKTFQMSPLMSVFGTVVKDESWNFPCTKLQNIKGDPLLAPQFSSIKLLGEFVRISGRRLPAGGSVRLVFADKAPRVRRHYFRARKELDSELVCKLCMHTQSQSILSTSCSPFSL